MPPGLERTFSKKLRAYLDKKYNGRTILTKDEIEREILGSAYAVESTCPDEDRWYITDLVNHFENPYEINKLEPKQIKAQIIERANQKLQRIWEAYRSGS